MKQEYIVIRKETKLNPSANLDGGANALLNNLESLGLEKELPKQPGLEVHKLSKKEMLSVEDEADVRMVIPTMPLRLMEPVESLAATPENATEVAWGIEAVGAHLSNRTGRGVTVAVLDTGWTPDHPAFVGIPPENILFKNFTNESDADEHGHGTHCAGTIFGRDVDGKRIGVAPGVDRVLIGKVLGQNGGSTAQILNAIQWALQNGANVISMSLGIDFPGYVKDRVDSGIPVESATSDALDAYTKTLNLFESIAEVVKSFGALGTQCILVAAAGNESMIPTFRINVAPPAAGEGFLSVGALEKKSDGLEIARFSNTGSNLCAPGVKILSAAPNGGLQMMSGTSMATPHVAGVAALWAEELMAKNQFTAKRLLNKLQSSATHTKLRPGFRITDVGDGIVQAP